MNKMTTKDLALIALFSALTAVTAQVSIYLPFMPVPISLSFIGVFTSAAVLGARRGAISQLVYILLGAFGLPVFAGMRGGLSVLVGATGGYLIGYVLMALVVGMFVDNKKAEGFLRLSAVMALSLLPCYAVGTAWLSISQKLSLQAAFAAGVAPFFVFDILKALFTAYFSVQLKRIMLEKVGI